MGGFRMNPVCLILQADIVYLVVGRSSLTLGQVAKVDFIFQNPGDRVILPLRNITPPKCRLKPHALLTLVLHRCGNAALVQALRNSQDGKPIFEHSKNHRHDFGSIIVHNQPIFIFG